jgi:aspartyl-tRNA synthetase
LIEWVKRPQVGLEWSMWNATKMELTNHPWINSTIKMTWVPGQDNRSKGGDMILFYLSADKTRTQLSALRMELATRLGLRIPTEFAPLWVVDFHY